MKIKNLMEAPNKAPKKAANTEQNQQLQAYEKAGQVASKLESVKRELESNMWEAQQLLHQLESTLGFRTIALRAKAYWFPHIKMAIDSNHDYMGSDTTLQDTIDDILEEIQGEGVED